MCYAKEGADVSIIYLSEHCNAEETKRQVEEEGRRCLAIAGDIGGEAFCHEAVERTVKELGRLDNLANNAAEQHPQDSIEKISAGQLERTFRTNIFSFFFLTKAALGHLKEGSAIINTTSVMAYKATRNCSTTRRRRARLWPSRALSQSLVEQGIRVNSLAPGPIWTPLIPATFPPEKVASFLLYVIRAYNARAACTEYGYWALLRVRRVVRVVRAATTYILANHRMTNNKPIPSNKPFGQIKPSPPARVDHHYT
jgi:NAD(P)-dependent dehydrogenase (short-subunit alcohol dehydrogenase family)